MRQLTKAVKVYIDSDISKLPMRQLTYGVRSDVVPFDF